MCQLTKNINHISANVKIPFLFFNLLMGSFQNTGAASTSGEAGKSGGKPNLLFIITDQQRFDALGHAGNKVIKTPNLDRLAKKGAFFRNAYAPCAVCGPSRSSMLTGTRIETNGVTSNTETYDYNEKAVMTMPTFDEILAQNGYHCEYYGKWHALSSHAGVYKNPVQYAENGKYVFGSGGQNHIWEGYLNALGTKPEPGVGQFKDGMSKYPYIANPLDRFYGKSYQELIASNLVHTQPDQHGKLLLNVEHTLTAFQAKQTLEALDRLKDKTFSLTCSFHFPHSPMLVPEPYYGMYPVDQMIPPVSINDPMTNSPYANSNSRTSRTEYADPAKIKYMISEYYGIITEIDDWVGKILDKLDALGLADNTLIIFTSDHGEMLGAHGMREKNIFLEESSHIPLLVSFPGKVKAETTVNGYVSLVDLFPTILDYLNVPEAKSDGKSLRGLIDGTDTKHGKYVVTEWDRENNPNYMVVKDGWKLIIPYTIQSTVINVLYDLNTDPYEMNNLLGANPERENYKGKAEELRACLLEWLAEQNSIHYYSVSKRDLMNGGKPTGNNAVFVSQQIPKFLPGQKHTVSLTVKNTGTTTWTKEGNFKLISQSPERNLAWGLNEVNLKDGEQIAPNAEKTFTFDITVPNFDGNYQFQWQMIQEAEEWFGEKSTLEKVVIGDPGSYLDDCDLKTGWLSSQPLTVNAEAQKQGAACIEYSGSSTDEFKKSFSTPFNSGLTKANGVLQFWYYISDASKMGTSNQVELGSAGKNDIDEYSWKLTNISSGWNYLQFNVSEANTIGNPDMNAINWFRLYSTKKAVVTTRLDAIQIQKKTTVSSSFLKNSSSLNLKVDIYPNPLNGNILSINLEGFEHTNTLTITISNLLGQIVYQEKIESKNNFVIDTGILPKSFYLLTVKSGESVVTTKLIVE